MQKIYLKAENENFKGKCICAIANLWIFFIQIYYYTKSNDFVFKKSKPAIKWAFKNLNTKK